MKTKSLKRRIAEIKLFFRSFERDGERQYQRSLNRGALFGHLLIHEDAPALNDLPLLDSDIEQYRWRGFRIKVEYTQDKMPDGYMAYIRCYRGAKLLFQRGWTEEEARSSKFPPQNVTLHPLGGPVVRFHRYSFLSCPWSF